MLLGMILLGLLAGTWFLLYLMACRLADKRKAERDIYKWELDGLRDRLNRIGRIQRGEDDE